MNLFKPILHNFQGCAPRIKAKTLSFKPFSRNKSIAMSYKTYEDTTPSTERPPLLIMHGLFGSKSNWNSLAKAFNQKTRPPRQVIAVDARNHGESPHTEEHSYALLAEDIKVLLESLNISKVALLGHSMGGRAVMHLALSNPALVEKLIVVDISPVSTSPSLSSMPELFALMLNVALPRDVSSFKAKQEVDKQLAGNIADKDLRAFLLTNLQQRADGSYAWRINIRALGRNFHEHIARFPKSSTTFPGPALFLSGGNSNYIQKTDRPSISRLFPSAEFVEIPDAGHWVHSEKPHEFLDACTEFLNRKP